jgi:hypothetical protein
MNLTGLVARMREEFLDDLVGASVGDCKWSDANLVAALNSAERELCKRLFLLHDAASPAICQINIAQVTGVYPREFAISDKILRIERLKYPGVHQPLEQTTFEKLDGIDPGWDEIDGTLGVPSARGVPSLYVVDFNTGLLTFNRQPIADGVVRLQVKRLPLADLSATDMTTSPEIKQLDDELIHGALKFAYLKDDSRTFDPTRAKVWGDTFESDIRQITQNRAAFNPREYTTVPERF